MMLSGASPLASLVVGPLDVRVRARVESGQSVVYEGIDQLGRHVAVKVARDQDEGVSLEIDLLAQLRSEHLPRLLAHGRTNDGDRFLVTEWIAGKPLDRACDFRGGMRASIAVRLALQMSRALSAIHRAGWVHGDLKPPNQLLTPDGLLVLIDLGLAQPCGRVLGRPIGTYHLCAPEVHRSEAICFASDVYAVGTLLYAMLEARTPFSDEPLLQALSTWTPERWIRAHVHGAVLPMAPSVPPALRCLIAACLAKDPAARPAGGVDLARALEGLEL